MTEDEARLPAAIPMIAYEDVGAASDWLVRAFGFEEVGRWGDDDGRVTQTMLRTSDGDGVVMPGLGSPVYQSPRRHAQSCEAAREWTKSPYIIDGVLVYVSDLPSHYARAIAEGAVELSGIEENEGVGQRQYRVEDVEGHRWMFAETTG